MKKKVIYMLLAMSLSTMLTACGHEHTWVEATCTQPKHCSECEETEGDALEHIWVDATCLEAKHCSVCGQTEGEALPHTFTEANYQEPSTCEVCAETEGEKLQAGFEKYGLKANIEWDVPYTYVRKNKEGYNSVGTITFSDYEIISSNEDLEEKEGYEWRVFNATMTWNDNDAENIKCSYFSEEHIFFDYYNLNNDDSSGSTIVVNYNGNDYTDCKVCHEKIYDAWENGGFTMIVKFVVQVPVGYDGLVLAMVDDRTVEQRTEESSILDVVNENTGYLRIK